MENNCEILFLGTCACDFSPLLKTDFKDKFDKDARRASVMLIDDRFMVDCGVHALDSMRIAEKKTEKITDIFITHIHYDHFTAGNIAKIAENREIPLRLWVREDAVFDEIDGVEVIRMKLYERYEVSDNVYVTGIIANHNEESTPQHFVFENKGKKIFYGCDGGWFIAKSFNALRKGEFDLSEMFVVHKTMEDRATAAVRTHGDISYAPGGSFYDVIYCYKHYGMVPNDVMPGIKYDSDNHNHNELASVAGAYVGAIAKSNSKRL